MKPDPSLRRPPPPGALEAVVRAGRLRRARVVGAAVTVAAVVTLAGVVISSSGGPAPTEVLAGPSLTPSGQAALPCPTAYDGRHPPDASGGASTTQLAPSSTPVTAVVCRYVTDGGELPALAGRRLLNGDLDRVAGDLSVPPLTRGTNCGFSMVSRTPYLLRLGYADGSSAWVGDVAGACPAKTTNGPFVSYTAISGQLAASFTAGSWTRGPDLQPCLPGLRDRLGQQSALVPDGWSSVRLCEDAQTRTLSIDQAARIVDLVDGLALTPKGGPYGCPRRGRLVQVSFDYPTGRSVVVQVLSGCTPATFDNGSIAAVGTPSLQRDVLAVIDEG